MPQFFQAPADPRTQNFIDYVNRLQWERKQRELAREEERDKQQERTMMGGVLVASVVGGAVIGGIAAGAGAGAGAAGTAGMAGSGISTATGAGAVISAAEIAAATTGAAGAGGGVFAGALAGAGQGLMYGARYGLPAAQQFAQGDYAGAAGTAASAATNIIQASRDRKLYGYSPSKEERTDLRRLAVDAGMSLGQVEMSAQELGMRPMEIIQAAQVGHADDAMARKVFGQLGFTGTLEEADVYPGGRIGLAADLQKAGAEQEIEQAGNKAWATVSAQRAAEASAGAEREQMEYRFDPRELSQRSADLNEIDELVDTGEFSVQQGAQRKAIMRRLVPSLQPRRTPITYGDVADKQAGVAPVVTPDGTLLGWSYGSLDRDQRMRQHNFVSVKEAGGGLPGFAAAMGELTLTQQMDLVSKAAQDAFLGGDRQVTPTEAVGRLKGGYDALQAQLAGPPVPPTGQAGPDQGVAAPGVPRASQAYAVLSQMVSSKPVERWTPQEFEQASQLLDTVILDIQQSGASGPQVEAMLTEAIQLSKVINARRNR